jgi:hypothetical protein
MQDDDSRIHFRELEVEVANTFSARAAAELMDQYEASGSFLLDHTPAELRKTLAEMVPGIQFLDTARSVEDLLTSARFPDEMLPRAAADTAGNKIVGNRVVMSQGRLVRIEPVEADLSGVHEPGAGSVGFSGRLIVEGEMPPPDQVRFRLETKSGRLILPEVLNYDISTGSFTVTFSVPSINWKRLCWAII